MSGGPGPDGGVRTYYGQPVLKEPAWTWEVPWYLFTGGLAGASSALAVAARASGRPVLAERAGLVAAAGALASPPLLVADLGRPARFLNMLRVFRPTSAMSMGSWLLAAYSPVAVGAAALGRLGRLPRVRTVAEGGAAVMGSLMTTYTAVLVSDSSIPVWHEARRELPWLFASSAAASAGAAAVLATPSGEAGPARRLALLGAAGELAAGALMRRRLGELAEPYGEGGAGAFDKAAKACTAVGAGLLAAGAAGVRGGARARPRVRRVAGLAGAALLVAGGVCQRWAVYLAGFASARDPRYTVQPQRERLERGEGLRAAPERGAGAAPERGAGATPERGAGAAPAGEPAGEGGDGADRHRTRPPARQSTAATPGGDAYTTPQDVEPGDHGIVDDHTVNRPVDVEPGDEPVADDHTVTRPVDIEPGDEPVADDHTVTRPSDVEPRDRRR